MPVDSFVQVGASVLRTAEAVQGVVPWQAVAASGKVVPTPAPPPPAPVPGFSGAELDLAVRHLSDYVQTLRRDLQFSVDQDSGRSIVRVVDSETGELIRQIPAEEVLAVARALGHSATLQTGILLQGQA